jgi:hypothetical protein
MSQVKLDQKRFNANRAEAHNDNKSYEGLPLRTRVRIAPTVQKAERHFGMYHPDESDRTVACVPSLTGVGEYTTDLQECDCLLTEVEGDPCSHRVHLGSSTGVPLVQLFDPKDTTEGWRRQYPMNLNFSIPSESIVQASNLVRPNLQLPVAIRKPKGGAKQTKRIKGFLQGGGEGPRKKAPGTCGICFKAGHNSRQCPDKK